MKKKLLLFIALFSILFSAACDDEKQNTDSSKTVSSEQNVSSSDNSSENSSENSAKESQLLLMKTFGELWMSDNYYIDVNMTVEYDPDTVSASSSTDESDNKSDSSSGLKTVNYSYIIAVDRINGIAGLNMISDMGNSSELVKDKYIYNINHADKTYTKQLYNGTADDFGEGYTTKICLGLINNCEFVKSGKTTYKNYDVSFEQYSVKRSSEDESPSIGDTTITYYFDEDGKALAEIIQTNNGKTTFEFKSIYNSIIVKDILTIPEGYKEVSS